MKEAETPNRREFMGRMARASLLTLSVVGTGSLMARRGSCDRAAAFCRDCAAFAGCRLPQARQTRKAASGRE